MPYPLIDIGTLPLGNMSFELITTSVIFCNTRKDFA
jgi:hypothetical protein